MRIALWLGVALCAWNGRTDAARPAAPGHHSDLLALIQNRARVAGFQFDDGLLTHYTVATPILRQYGLTGSFGIVTGNTNVSPNAMTDSMIAEMYFVDGYDFQDHTWSHNAALWGDPANISTWEEHIALSQGVFQRIGFPDVMRAWNQPGGTGEGFSDELRNTLKSHGYLYAAGRVGLSNHQIRNMHFGAIDDPFSWGRWCPTWKFNAPPANWTWQAEVEALKTTCADAWAQGGLPIILFHNMDADAAAGLDALCAWFVANEVFVLGMDDLNKLAQINRAAQTGLEIAPSLHQDLNLDGRPDGFDTLYYIDMNGNAINGVGSTAYGTPPGRLVARYTIRVPLQVDPIDYFSTKYERYTIDPVTWQYTITSDLRLHTIELGQTVSFTDTLLIEERVDRVKYWIQSINTAPFVVDSLSVVPLATVTNVAGRAPKAVLDIGIFPNPNASTATIGFHLDQPSHASVAIYSVDGKLVDLVLDEEMAAGEVKVRWQNHTVASGVYFVKVVAGRASATKKITLIR